MLLMCVKKIESYPDRELDHGQLESISQFFIDPILRGLLDSDQFLFGQRHSLMFCFLLESYMRARKIIWRDRSQERFFPTTGEELDLKKNWRRCCASHSILVYFQIHLIPCLGIGSIISMETATRNTLIFNPELTALKATSLNTDRECGSILKA